MEILPNLVNIIQNNCSTPQAASTMIGRSVLYFQNYAERRIGLSLFPFFSLVNMVQKISVRRQERNELITLNERSKTPNNQGKSYISVSKQWSGSANIK